MANKHQVAAAKAARKREEARKAKEQHEKWMKLRKPMLIGACCVVAALLIWALVNALYLPANAVRVSNGGLTGVGDDWVVSNFGTKTKPECYHLADMTTPDGYVVDPKNEDYQEAFVRMKVYDAEDSDAAVQQVFVSGVANNTAQAMADKLIGYGYMMEPQGPVTANIAGHQVVWVYGKLQGMDSTGGVAEGRGQACLDCYIDGIRQSSVVVILNSAEGLLTELPTAEEMLACAEPVLQHLTMTK